MGLFSSKKKTYVNTSVARMVEDADFYPSHKMAVLEYSLSESSSSNSLEALTLPDYLLMGSANNIVSKARKARNYAKKDSYAFGLPKANLVSADGVDIQAAIQDELEKIYPEGVIVKDAYFGPMNNFYFLRPMLASKLGYDYDTNELVEESKKKGFKCYMESAVIKYSKYTMDALIDPETLVQRGLSTQSGYTPFRAANPNAPQVPWVKDYPGAYDIAEVTVVYKDAAGQKKTYVLVLDYLEYEKPALEDANEGVLDDSSAENIDPNAVAPKVDPELDHQDYFQANYEYVEKGVTKRNTFIYLYGSGFSSLDSLFNKSDDFGSYIPRIYARMDGKKANDKSLKETNEYKSMVGICRQLGINWESWVDELHDSIGSLGDVTQILMSYSLPVNTKDKLIQNYMFEYFMGLYGRIPKKYATSNFNNLGKDMTATGAKQGQTIVIKDKAYEQRISFSSLGYIDVRGSIGEVGTVTSGYTKFETSMSSFLGKGLSNMLANASYHYFRKQLTTTTYREVRVYNLSSTEVVRGGKTTVASGESENLLLPLDMAINHEFNAREKEELYTKSMYVIVNTLKVVKKKWYQTGIFKAIMFIAAVVTSVFTGGQSLTLYAIIYAVVQTVAVSLVLQLAAKILVTKLGIDVGIVAAVIAVVAAAYGAYLAATKTTGMAGMTASNMMGIANESFRLSSNGFAIQAQVAVKAFISTMTDLSQELKDMIEKAKELGLGAHGPLLMYEPPLAIGIKMGEEPEQYFSRSIHTHNIGGAIYSLIENHVDYSLQLPTKQMILSSIQETIDELQSINE